MYLDRACVGQYLGYITELPLGSYVVGVVGFIGGEDLGLTYGRYVSTKETS